MGLMFYVAKLKKMGTFFLKDPWTWVPIFGKITSEFRVSGLPVAHPDQSKSEDPLGSLVYLWVGNTYHVRYVEPFPTPTFRLRSPRSLPPEMICTKIFNFIVIQQSFFFFQEHSHTPVKEVKVVDKRQQDPFREKVEGMMRTIECYFNTGRQPLSVRRGQQRYRSLVEEIYRKGLQERKNDVKKCCEHLFEYNKGRCRMFGLLAFWPLFHFLNLGKLFCTKRHQPYFSNWFVVLLRLV